MSKRLPAIDEEVELLEQIIEDIEVPKQKRKFALGRLRILLAKKMAEAQVRGVRISQDELRKEK